MAPTKVIIIGCGIAGPVLGAFLQNKGYRVVIYERTKRDSDAAGVSLMLQSNGLRVLSLLPNFDIAAIPAQPLDSMNFRSWMPDAEVSLAESATPRLGRERFGFQMRGAERPELQRMLIDTALASGVEIHWEQTPTALEQGDDEVRVLFADGAADTASFVIGCDGIHSSTRAALFGKERADYTGCTQIGGVSVVEDLKTKGYAMTTIYGNGNSLIMYPISDRKVSWAVTQFEAEERDTWRAMDAEKQEEFKKGPLSQWGFEGAGLIASAHRIVKYGLYDRPQLTTWHKGRVALLGDAAHPTSPHLGQGANQAFEDVYHLVRLLTQANPTAAPQPTAALAAVFAEYEGLRIARTAILVNGARRMGELRVVGGVDACLARNETVRRMYTDDAQVLEKTAFVLEGPFTGASEI
ncbi:FAD/NAD(P)-binding domain-containing protein [Athelia psychrophila]|uniref:FAD/NAD(P)-binding domain-containing protein n=1 Tax=Athelia psychrophila TaxID=1759441 RepID=A0A166WZ81_9AGAM|nr:FAD/NAD(P)-binding domain-containing protein [Fibularhizoctonia sp. CBS 109695]